MISLAEVKIHSFDGEECVKNNPPQKGIAQSVRKIV